MFSHFTVYFGTFPFNLMELWYSSWQANSKLLGRRKGSLLSVFLSVLVHELVFVGATEFQVGGGYVPGWTNSPGSDYNATLLAQQYAEWANSVSITVGDTLVFNYDDLHTVVIVPTKDLFDRCNFGGPGAIAVSTINSTPPARYTVTSTSPLYFVCTIASHCLEGQKVAVTDIRNATSNEGPAVATQTSSGGLTRPGRLNSSLVVCASLLSILHFICTRTAWCC